jgi:hypothetical protein
VLLVELIAETVVDCYDEGECMMAFRRFPAGSVAAWLRI